MVLRLFKLVIIQILLQGNQDSAGHIIRMINTGKRETCLREFTYTRYSIQVTLSRSGSKLVCSGEFIQLVLSSRIK